MARSDAAPVFSGRREGSDERMRGHRHALILPEALDRDARISHILVCARMGFDRRAVRALDGLRKVWGRGGHDLQLVLAGLGQPRDLGGADVRAGQSPCLAESAVWESCTPFVPTRHPKTYKDGRPKVDDKGLQIGSPEHDLRRLLREAGHPESIAVRPLDALCLRGRTIRWLRFRTERHRGGGRRAGLPCGFRIEFAEPVRGPVAVGYGAHFGLGAFVPVL